MGTEEQLLVELVRSHADRARPGDREGAARAVSAALLAFAGGASMSEAYLEGRHYLACWAGHPSHQSLADVGLARAS